MTLIAERCWFCRKPVESEAPVWNSKRYVPRELDGYVLLLNNEAAHVQCLPRGQATEEEAGRQPG